jgi:hypothetical protein
MANESSEVATRSSWNIHGVPKKRAPLNFSGRFSDAEYEQIKVGLIPDGMDDKWFMFFEAPWLYLHSSWTGFCIYGVRLEASAEGATIVEAWVNRDKKQWGAPANANYDVLWLRFFIDALLLNKPTPFPGKASPLAQHILTGRVFPDASG